MNDGLDEVSSYATYDNIWRKMRFSQIDDQWLAKKHGIFDPWLHL